ncbi:sugar kinase [Streptomyces olivaceus]|uniref:sugar kinase n=1 Tax=Streptomyces olivaceus TaxID=47716 RepID=UPI0033B50C39
MTEILPHPAPSPEESGPPGEDRRHRIRRRALTLITIVLLIGVPAGYLAISAGQSRDSGRDKEAKYAATGMTRGWPSKLQRRIYEVPVPVPADKIAYYETNNWKTSRLYVQFETTAAGLDVFLAGLDLDRDALQKDKVTIGDRAQRVTGWKFRESSTWWGVVNEQSDPAPTQDIVVDLDNPDYPMVYLVSHTVP